MRNIFKQKFLALVLPIAALAVGQSAMADTVTYGIDGTAEPNPNNGTIIVNLNITASGSATGTASKTWDYISAQSISDMSLPGNIKLSFGSDKTSSLLVKDNILGIRAEGTTGGYITLSHASKYIYHVTLKDRSGTVIHEAWNMTKSYEYRFQSIEVKFIEVEYATAIPITDAVISGINDSYIVSNTAVTPTPTVTWHGTTLTKGTHYTLSYQNNTSAGTATIKATGKGIFSTSTNVSKNYTLVWATYSVRFNKNSDSADGTMGDQAFTYATAQNLTANAFTRTGYTFDHWTTNADGSGDSYTDGQSVTNLTPNDGGTFNLYAQWTDLWGIADGANGSEGHPYIITTTDGLDLLAKMVNGTDGYTANNFDGKFFKLGANITYSYEGLGTDESNFTAIGSRINGYNRYFRGIFDGDGYTVSGIRIRKGSDNYQGLFGMVPGGTIKNVTLTDADITGKQEVGGIAGYIDLSNNTDGIIENCHVTSSVAIHAVADYASYHGGIVGDVNGGTVSGCTSAATLTVAEGLTGCYNYGGIAGDGNGNLENNLVVGANVSGNSPVGAVAGYKNDSHTYTANYYRSCTVNGTANATGVGVGYEKNVSETPHDIDGVRSVHTLTLPTDVTATGESVTIGTDTYYASNTTVTLAYTGSLPADCLYSVNGESIAGNTFTMPAEDVTVTAALTDVWGVTNDADGSESKPYIITTTDGLDLLAKMVNGTDGYTANNFDGKFFKLGANITYSYEGLGTDESNFTAISGRINGYTRYFRGIFDGDGYTVSGIRIRKGSDNYQGLFGYVSGGTIKNVTLTDADITGKQNVGGIAGYINMNASVGGIIENCHVTNSVAIHAVADYASYHGGIVGHVNSGTVSGCTSTATLTVAEGLTGCDTYGGIVGDGNGNLENNLVVGANVSGNSPVGAVAGYIDSSNTYSANYYRNCTVNGTANATGVGVGGDENVSTPYDIDGVRSVHTLTLPTDVTATATVATSYSGTDYYTAGTAITLGYTGSMPEGYQANYSYNDGTAHALTANTFEMPAADVTVSTAIDVIPWSGSGDSENDPYIISYPSQLDLLAKMVNGTDGYTANNFSGKYFKLDADITYTPTDAWNNASSTENNYTAIGYDSYKFFSGTFDGYDHTVSGIRIYKPNDNHQGLFGHVKNCTVKNVTLSNARITGKGDVGGIVGGLYHNNDLTSTIENCHVDGTVAIHAVTSNAIYHGGIVGYISSKGTVSGSTSSASLTIADNLTGCQYYGGIVGGTDGTVSNCLAIGATVSGNRYVGAIAGYKWNTSTPLTANYYRNCTVGNMTSNVGVGFNETNGSDCDGARGVYALTLADGVTATGENVEINSTTYYAAGTTVTYTYNGSVPNGYVLDLSVKDAGGNDVTVTESEGSYTFTMPASDATVSGITDVWGIAGGADGSEEHPYLITTTTGLDLLATKVNSGTTYSSTYFKLDADITYPHTTAWNDATSTEDNYTAIGISTQKSFQGHFDGDGHTVSGIRIHKDNTPNQGLFGYVADGTVENVILTDARITGARYVGGITGNLDNSIAKVENCIVNNSVITANMGCGAVVGYCFYGTLSHNYYHGCIVNIGSNIYTSGIGIGDPRGDTDGARGVYALTLADGVTATGENVEINSTTYYAAGTTVTYTYNGSVPNGYVLDLSVKDAGGNDVTVTESEGSYTFTMPASDATVSGITDVWDIAGGADGSKEHPYIITTTAGLDLLATRVNSDTGDDYASSGYSGKFFTLGADITYSHTTDWNDATSTENNFTTIGTSQMRSFRGTFNGDGHTVSGIRIYKDTDAEDSDEQGLFGYVNGGTVMNVTLSFARITGRKDVGGIVGMLINYDDTHPGAIENCHTDNVAIHSVVSDADCHGGIVGYLHKGTVSDCDCWYSGLTVADNLTSCDYYGGIVGYNNAGTLTANYYRNCTVGDKISNIGCKGSDRDGARGVYALTLADGITITAASESVVIGTSTYYASNSTVTCTYGGNVPEGYAISFNATDGTVSGNTITVPHQDITVSAVLTPVTYTIDYDLAGGSVATANPGSYTIETPSFTLTNPTREGYQFMGWTGTGLSEPTMSVTIAQGSTGNRSYTANWTTDFWGIAATGADGSEEHPYIITTTAGLDLLATRVNSGTGDDYAGSGYSGKFFKLGADIAYDYDSDPSSTENNFTTIGTNQMTSFRGTFDGDGYTVSGIRIYKDTDAEDSNNQGLFGYVNGGTVMNVTLRFARITGRKNVGGIAGMLINYDDTHPGAIKNCHAYDVAIHSVVSDADFHGGIVGNLYQGTVSDCDCWYSGLTVADNLTSCDYYGGIVGYNAAGTVSGCTAYYSNVPNVVSSYGLIAGYSNGTLTANYYTECRLNGVLTPTGMGCSGSDWDGARSVHYLMLDGYATATGESVVINGTTYYAGNTTVTLSVNCPLPDGLVCHGFALNGTALSGNTFTMPDWSCQSHCAHASAYILPDADIYLGGGAGTGDNPYVITTAEGLNMLSKAVSQMTQSCYGLYFQLGADIAYDPDVLTIDNDGDGVDESNFTPISYLNVHFQGRFDGQGHTISGIRCSGNNSSSLALFGALEHPDSYVRNVVVADASFTGNSQVGGIVAILYDGLVENCRVVGATLTSSSDLPGAIANFCTSGHLSHNYYFGCTATKQGSTPVTSGIGVHFCVMGDQAPIYNDDIESRTYDGVTYTDCAVEGVALYDDDSALPSGRRNADVIADNNGTGRNVMLYDRTLYRDGAWNTLCLPFDVSIADGPLSGDDVQAMTLNTTTSGVSGKKLTLHFDEVSPSGEQGGLIPAGTPFIIKWAEGDNMESPVFTSVTIDNSASTEVSFTGGKFVGTYASTTFNNEDKSILFLGASNKLYYPVSGARIGAFRAYFQLDNSVEVKEVVLSFGDEETSLNRPTPDPSLNGGEWYDLSGRRIESPKKRGVFIRNGKKVAIK